MAKLRYGSTSPINDVFCMRDFSNPGNGPVGNSRAGAIHDSPRPARETENAASPGDETMKNRRRSRSRPSQEAPGRRRATGSGPWEIPLLALVLVVLTTFAYVPALRSGFIWDDDAYVTENAALTSFAGLGRIWLEPGASPQYYPLTFTSLWVDYQLWGEQPFGYHAVNLALHLGSAFLLWRIFSAWWNPRTGWILAALFALHPLHVESVAWVTERKNVLSGFLYLASALVYLRGTGLIDAHARRPWRFWYAASLLLFVGALLSKTVTASLPAALLLATWWRSGRVGRDDLVRLIPFFVLGLGLGLVTVTVERVHVSGAGFDWTLTPIQRLLVAGSAVWFYALKLVWPHPLIFIYPRWNVDQPDALLYLAPFAAIAVVVVLFFLRERLGRGPICAVLFFGGTLFPALGFFDVYPMRFSFVADHFCYLASIGILALAVGGAAAASALAAPLSIALVAIALTLYSLLTWNRAHVYADTEVLWRDTIVANPSAWIARNNLATILMGRGEFDAAEVELGEALRLKPDLDDAHNNLGVIARQKGDLGRATAHFREAVRITPTFGAALANLASALQAQGRMEEAVPLFRAALATRHRDSRVEGARAAIHASIGIALESLDRRAEALHEYREAFRLDPSLQGIRDRLHALEGS